MADDVITIDLVRHGDVRGRQHVARGSTDNPLSDKGWKQLGQVKAAIGNVDTIITSPLKRCRLFAESCKEPVHVCSDFREIDFGDWEDKSADEVDNPDLLQRFFESPMQFQAPDGEHFECFAKRVRHAWQCMLEEDIGKHRFVLAHGCVIRVILADILNMPLNNIWRMVIEPAGWTRISIMAGEQPRILFINRVCHA
jgi:broad specificity phosphatase PhoE